MTADENPLSQPDEGVGADEYREVLFVTNLIVQEIFDALDSVGFMQPTLDRLHREADQMDAEGEAQQAEATRRLTHDPLLVIDAWACNLAEAKQRGEQETVCTGNGLKGDNDG